MSVLGNIPGTELYKDKSLYKDVKLKLKNKINLIFKKKKKTNLKAKEFDGIKIIRLNESLYSSNVAYFKKKIYECTNTKPQEYLAKKLKIERKRKRDAEKNIPLVLKVFYLKQLYNSLH